MIKETITVELTWPEAHLLEQAIEGRIDATAKVMAEMRFLASEDVEDVFTVNHSRWRTTANTVLGKIEEARNQARKCDG